MIRSDSRGLARLTLAIAVFLAFGATSLVVAQNPKTPKTNPKIPPGKQRFSADALTLLAEITNSYDVNGQRKPSGAMDMDTLDRLSRSKEPEVSEVANLVPKLKMLQMLRKEQGAVVQKTFEKQVQTWPLLMADMAIRALKSPPQDEGTLRDAAKMLEDMIGSKPQQEVNKAWAITVYGNSLSIALQQTLRDLAARGGPASADVGGAIDVVVETKMPGAISLTNRSGRPLSHCLIFTRLEADKKKIEAMAREEDLVGKFVLPALGFSDQTVKGSRKAAELRHMFNKQDKGVMVYVAEIPTGGKLTTQLSHPGYYSIAKGATMSLWCDEVAFENMPASNWAAVSQPAKKR